MQFDTERLEAGEALFQLKYRSDFNQVPIIGSQLYSSFGRFFSSARLASANLKTIKLLCKNSSQSGA